MNWTKLNKYNNFEMKIENFQRKCFFSTSVNLT